MRRAGVVRAAAARRRSGFALVVALGLLVVLSLLALEVSDAARSRRLAAASALDAAAGAAAARAGTEETLALLATSLRAAARRPFLARGDPAAAPPALDPWAAMAQLRLGPTALGSRGIRYAVVARDASDAIDLNTADADLLRRLLLVLRVDPARADHVAQAILDWRDADALRRAHGAERDDYLRAGSPVLPDDAPFRTVGTLRHVAGMDDALYDAVRPYLTILGGGKVNVNVAPAPVLRALPGMTEESVAALMRFRRQGHRLADIAELAEVLSPVARQKLLDGMGPLLAVITFETRELHVTSTATSPAGLVLATEEALVIRERVPRVAWRRMSP